MLFASLVNAPTAPLPPNEMLRFNPAYGLCLANAGRHAVAAKYLMLAESALRSPGESDMRRRITVVAALVDLERAWGARAPLAARAAALKRWTAARDAESPELRAAVGEGRAPKVGGGR